MQVNAKPCYTRRDKSAPFPDVASFALQCLFIPLQQDFAVISFDFLPARHLN
jgi:hypothetical protein